MQAVGRILGEVLRAQVGGDWTLTTPPNREAPAPALNIGGSLVFPTLKVFRRLTLGATENVAEFSRLVVARVRRETAG